MKHRIFQLAILGLMAGLVVSCNKEEQSEVNLDNLQGMASVTGKVMYNQGAANQNGAIISDYMVPAAGQTIIVRVPNSDYVSGSAGYQTYSDTTDSEGRYTVQVPVGTNTVTATVSVIPFFAEKTVEGHNNQLINITNALYNNFTPQQVTLAEFDVQTADFEVTSSEMPELEYNQEVGLTGLIEIQSWALNRETENREASKEPIATDFDVLVTLSDPAGIEPDMTLKYQGSSDAEGLYDMTMTLPDNCWEWNVSIELETKARLSNFVHYYYSITNKEWKSQDVEVVESAMTVSASLTPENEIIPVRMTDILVTTKPVDASTVYGIGNPIDTEDPDNEIATNNPFGWN